MSCNCYTENPVSTRKGNDIKITWSIYSGIVDPIPYNLEGKVFSVYLKNKYKKKLAQDVSVSGNTITCYYYGKDHDFLGPYSLEFVENEGRKGMLIINECNAFKLVSNTCDIDNGGSDGVICVTNLEFKTSKNIDILLSFNVDDDMNLNLTYRGSEELVDTFSIDEDGQLILNQTYGKDN